MLKMILTSLILWQTAYSSDSLSYTTKKYTSGTEFIRLNVPGSTKKWTCFDETMYARVIDNAYQLQIKDSLLAFTEKQNDLCASREISYQNQVQLLQENERKLLAVNDTVFSNYKKCNSDLSRERLQKWIWGGLGTLIGVAAGVLTMAVVGR